MHGEVWLWFVKRWTGQWCSTQIANHVPDCANVVLTRHDACVVMVDRGAGQRCDEKARLKRKRTIAMLRVRKRVVPLGVASRVVGGTMHSDEPRHQIAGFLRKAKSPRCHEYEKPD